MDSTLAASTIKQWQSHNKLTPAQILARLDHLFDEYYGLTSSGEAALQANFARFSELQLDGGQRLNQDGLSKLLQTSSHLPEETLSAAAAKLIFRSISYLSTIPFPPKTAADPIAPSLSLPDLTRGLVWLMPGRAAAMLRPGSWTRTRTAADHRRLVFQSLATRYDAGAVYDAQGARERAARNAVKGVEEGGLASEFAACNHDEDGDEMFHDVLDVLFATQPRPNRALARVKRDDFREVAEGVAAGDGGDVTRRLHKLSIDRESEKALMRVLDELAGRQGEESRLGAGGGGTVTWSVFDDVLNSQPQLLDPLFDLVQRAMLTSNMG